MIGTAEVRGAEDDHALDTAYMEEWNTALPLGPASFTSLVDIVL